MVPLEGELLLLGIWKNVEDLEESLNLEEMNVILDAAREQEHRRNKFAAALKGIDIDEGVNDSIQDRFDAIEMRAFSRVTGKSEDELVIQDFGFDFETE